MANTVLVVCTANVCRSRLAQAVLERHLLYAAGDGTPNPSPQWNVISAGTRAVPDVAMCTGALGQSGRVGLSNQLRRRSTELTEEVIDSADLVLTAERAHRSEVLALRPQAREKTFTLAEFDLMVQQFPPSEDDSATDGIHGLAQIRPKLSIPVARPTSRWRRPSNPDPMSALDIVDGHVMSHQTHLTCLEQVETTASRIAPVLASWHE